MEDHHFSWVNQLFLWQFSIAMLCWIPRGQHGAFFQWEMLGASGFSPCFSHEQAMNHWAALKMGYPKKTGSFTREHDDRPSNFGAVVRTIQKPKWDSTNSICETGWGQATCDLRGHIKSAWFDGQFGETETARDSVGFISPSNVGDVPTYDCPHDVARVAGWEWLIFRWHF